MENNELRNEVLEEKEELEEVERYFCGNCGSEVESEDYLTYIESEDIHVCEHCLNNHYTFCEYCERFIPNDEAYYIEDRDIYVCYDCLKNHYYTCENCGNHYSCDGGHWDDDIWLCDECWEDREEENDTILDWHDHKGTFKKQLTSEDNDNTRTYGFELEIDHQDYCKASRESDLISYFNERIPVVYERDGSLSSAGVEVISQPMSWNYIQEHKEQFRECLEYASSLGYTSHENGHCGMHIHVSTPSNEVINKIELVLETFKDELINFSRRDKNNNHYWAFMSDSIYDYNGLSKEEQLSIKNIDEFKNHGNRYHALNLTNSDTIEFRIFRGTLKFETFMANLELVNNIMNLCESDIDLKDITWEKLVEGEFASEYAKSRGINCDKHVVDYTEILKKLEVIKKEIINDSIKLLTNSVKKAFSNLTINNNMSGINEFKDIKDKFDKLVNEQLSNINDLIQVIDSIERRLKDNSIEAALNRINYVIENYQYSGYGNILSKYAIGKLKTMLKRTKEISMN